MVGQQQRILDADLHSGGDGNVVGREPRVEADLPAVAGVVSRELKLGGAG